MWHLQRQKRRILVFLPKYVKNQKPSETVILYAGINIIYQGRILNNSEIIEFLILNYFLIFALVIFHEILFSRVFFTDFFLKEELKWKTFKLLFTAGYFFPIFIFMMILNKSVTTYIQSTCSLPKLNCTCIY